MVMDCALQTWNWGLVTKRKGAGLQTARWGREEAISDAGKDPW